MFLSHIAVALFLKRFDPGARLGFLVLAALLPDFLLGAFVVAGLESILIPQNAHEAHYLTYVFPYSHGLVAIIGWGAFAAVVSFIRSRRMGRAGLYFLAVFSHFAMDAVIHGPELPLLGEGSPMVGVGLISSYIFASGFEIALLIAGLVVYLTSPPAKHMKRSNNIGLSVYLMVLAVYGLGGQYILPTPPNEMVPAIFILVQVLVIAGFLSWLVKPIDIMTAQQHESFIKRLSDLLSGKALFRKKKRKGKGKKGEKDAPAEEKKSAADLAAEAINEAPDEPIDMWSKERIEIAETLWGESYLTPGGSKFVIEQVRMLALDETKSMLDIGAGIGGPARTLTNEYGIWVTGLETVEELVELGKHRSKVDELEKKAEIKRVDLEKAKFKEKGYNIILSLESLFTVKDKKRLFEQICNALRVDGFFIYTDYVLTGSGAPNDKVKHWFTHEPIRPSLWSPKQVADCLNELPVEVHQAHDISEQYKGWVLKAWYNYVSTLQKNDIRPRQAEAIIDECEHWLNRIAAVDSGGVAVYHFVAMRPYKKRVS